MYTVYAHRNLSNGKSYIGMTSQNPKRRWNSGRGYQRNPKIWADIQNSDWDSDWQHNILGQFENKQEALKYESFLIAMLDTVRNGYNTSAYASHSCKHLEESKRKMSEAQTGEKNHWYGKHRSEETKKKISEANTGKHPSEETRKKISQSMGVNGILQFSKDGELIAEYSSLTEASRQTGCNNSHICECCKGKQKSCGGYIWKYKNI